MTDGISLSKGICINQTNPKIMCRKPVMVNAHNGKPFKYCQDCYREHRLKNQIGKKEYPIREKEKELDIEIEKLTKKEIEKLQSNPNPEWCFQSHSLKVSLSNGSTFYLPLFKTQKEKLFIKNTLDIDFEKAKRSSFLNCLLRKMLPYEKQEKQEKQDTQEKQHQYHISDISIIPHLSSLH